MEVKNGVNIFANRKVSKAFYSIIMKLSEEERTQFSKRVRDLFFEKSVAEEGGSFKIEADDLDKVLQEIGISAGRVYEK